MTHYIGKPCKQGHSGKRYVSTRSCVECQRLSFTQQYAADPDKVKQYVRRWQEKHPEHRAVIEANREASKAKRTPAWADKQSIAAIYAVAAAWRVAGFDVQVDHEIPLRGKLVSGFHCESNLRIIPTRDNQRKRNHYGN